MEDMEKLKTVKIERVETLHSLHVFKIYKKDDTVLYVYVSKNNPEEPKEKTYMTLEEYEKVKKHIINLLEKFKEMMPYSTYEEELLI